MRASVFIGTLMAVLLIAPSLQAEDPIGWVSLGGSAGISSYALGDVNQRIDGDGNRFIREKGWTLLDPLKSGWTFWGDVKVQIPWADFLFVGGGYGVSSGSSGGKDYNELITVEASQKAYHARLLYALPFRFHDDVRLFVGGGPLIIQEQKIDAKHTHRSSAGGETPGIVERTEEVYYTGDGMGWQLGMAAEYMVQDRLTLTLDVAYRMAKVDYGTWSPGTNVRITDTGVGENTYPDGTTSTERLDYSECFVGRAFLDWTQTNLNGELANDLLRTEPGPYVGLLAPLAPDRLKIDLSGIQVHIGLRFYIL